MRSIKLGAATVPLSIFAGRRHRTAQNELGYKPQKSNCPAKMGPLPSNRCIASAYFSVGSTLSAPGACDTTL